MNSRVIKETIEAGHGPGGENQPDKMDASDISWINCIPKKGTLVVFPHHGLRRTSVVVI